MNFDLSEEQQVIKNLALQIFSGQATVERVKAVEKADGFDRDLWNQLANSGIQALCVPESFGGSGFGAVELSLALMGQGRHVAPVPLWSSGVAALALSDFGNESQQAAHLPGIASGDTVVGIALAESGANDVMRPAVVATTANGRVTVRGFKPAVPFAQHASLLIVPVLLDGVEQIVLLDPNQSGVTRTPVTTTNHEPHAHVDIDTEVSVDAVLGHGAGIDGREALRSLFEHSLAALAAIQVGVAEGSLALTASHLSGRTQFGKPLSAFQATTQRAADGYITTEAMREIGRAHV